MREKQRGTLVFCLSMAISLVVLGVFLLFILWSSRTAPADRTQSGVPAPERRPSQAETLQLLILGCEEQNRLPSLIQLLRYDAPTATVTVFFLPCDTLVTLDGRTDTLRGHYSYTGIRGAMQAVSELLQTELSFYMRTDREGVAALCDAMGGVAHTFESDTVLGGTLFWAGRQQLDGRRFAAALFANDLYGNPQLPLQEALTAQLLRTGLTVDRYTRIAGALFATETNLSRYELAKREISFLSALKANALKTRTQTLLTYPADQGGSRPDRVSLYGIKAQLSR